MIYIVIALKAEASLIIDTNVLKQNDDAKFSIFESSTIKLIISGVGKINSAIATSYLLTKYQADKDDSIINIGMAGSSAKKDVGEMFMISKIIDDSSNKVFHLQSSQKSPITCVDIPKDNNISFKTKLVDMESSGFYNGAKVFIKKENIKVLKIVSDNLDTDIKDDSFIQDLFLKHKDKIKEVLR